ncbi:hypothetical protein LCGC14_0755780 [marine sediment metagenome]|uniref:Uncharacterized protein n=1 Tax=marine sediment metagenome TaxID=412755 RepID=A0A0F9QMG2_9ZZZZ
MIRDADLKKKGITIGLYLVMGSAQDHSSTAKTSTGFSRPSSN